MINVGSRLSSLSARSKIGLAAGAILLVLVLTASMSLLFKDSESANAQTVRAPASAQDLEGQKYEEVVRAFKDAGFTKVTTEPIKDLITGWITNDGEVEKTTIAGESDFLKGTRYPPDAIVTVYYHTFPDKPTQDPKSIEKTASPTPSPTTPSPSPEPTKTESPTPTSEPAKHLTPENNADLNALLQVKEPTDPSVAVFAKTYAGQEVEFDANFCNVMPHGDATTRFDVLICPGDFDPEHASGPSFKFEDINPQVDLNLPTLTNGTNIHLIARIGEYSSQSGLFFLDPVEVQIR